MYENKEKTTGIVLLTHGMFGSALLESASMIYGKIENAIAIPLLPDTDMEEYAQRVQSACKQFPNVLLLIDLFGGTPCNELIKLFPTHDWKAVTGLLGAALCKFALLYVLVTHVICGLLAQPLLTQGLLKEPMLKALPATFSAPQLVTALIGGAVALLVVPVLKKALRKA